MNFSYKHFSINLINYSDTEILININNLQIDFNIEINNIIDIIKSNYNELEIKLLNYNNLYINQISIIIKILNNNFDLNIIDPDNNHICYLNKYLKTITPSILLKYNVIALSIAGLIIKDILLKKFNIVFFTHVNTIKNISDKVENYEKLYYELSKFKNDQLPIVDSRAKILIQKILTKTIHEKKSISGSLQTIIYNLPKGIGIPYYNLFESNLSKYLYMIPNLKALEFNEIFNINKNNEQIYKNILFDNDRLLYDSNINIGIEQGITTGENLIFNTHFLPPLTYNKNSKSINYKTLETLYIQKNTYEYFNLHKQIFIIESLSAIAIYELITKQA